MSARCMAVLLTVSFWLPGCVYAQSLERFALTAQEVAGTLSGHGIQIADSQVSLPAKVVATKAHPVLDVLSIASLGLRWSEGRSESHSLVKIGCHEPGTCLPFYAIVNWPEGTIDAGSASSLPGSASAKLKANAPVAIRAGAHALLEMDDNRSHIEVAVISLQNGNAGDKIRVATPDRKQTYTAEVIGANLLKGSY